MTAQTSTPPLIEGAANMPEIIRHVRLGSIHDLKQSLANHPDSINQQDDMGLTALHWAAHLRFFEAVEFILETGKADIFIKDSRNKTVMDHALAGNDDRIITMLLRRATQNKNEGD